MSRIIKALFGGYNKVTATASTAAWQYDYGQILKINGLQLPEVYEVHFSNTPEKGVSKTALGNADGVEIPDEYFLSGEPVYAFIYLHDTASDGETEYRIEIPVKPRPRPTHEEPTPVQQSEIEQLIAALNTATEEAEQSAQEAREAAESVIGEAERAEQSAIDAKREADAAADKASKASGYAESASASATTADTRAGDAETAGLKAEGYAVGKQNGTDVPSGSPYYHNNAKYFSEQSSGAAGSAAGSAEEARQTAQDLKNSVATVEETKQFLGIES